MTSISPERSRIAQQRPYVSQFVVREMWASLAISVMWLCVVLDALFGPDIVTNSGVGDIGEHTTVPSAVVVALFAFLGTWVVARYGLRPETED